MSAASSAHASQNKSSSSMNIDEFSKSSFQGIVNATKASNALPGPESFSFYSTFPTFKEGMDDVGKRILVLAEKLIRVGDPSGSRGLQNYDSAVDDTFSRFDEDVVPFLDELYEQVDLFMDEQTGETGKAKDSLVTTPSQLQVKLRPNTQILHGSNINRPQDSWKIIVDNSPAPFVPKLVEKPHAKVPLDPAFSSISLESNGLGRYRRVSKTSAAFPHPYEHELATLDWAPGDLKVQKEVMFGALETTPLTIVSTVSQLKEMVSVLERCAEVAIDVEHHDYRSFLGITCLIQISTRQEDFLVDPFGILDDLHLLNRVTANPRIMKVLHGSDRDILWLQRDCGVYIVNMFDTGQASRVLDMPSFALAFLLKHYCGVSADKQYQLADWRIRPLPAEMIKYAREDTHYLLYIYDRLRNEALARGNESANLLRSILDRSRELCLQTYEKDVFTEESYRDLYEKSTYSLDSRQLRVFAALYKWRDTIARQEDESVRYVLPNHMMFSVAELVPTSTNDLLALLKPIPPLVRINASDVVNIITQAVIEPSNADASVVSAPSLFQEAKETVSGIGVKTVKADAAPISNPLNSSITLIKPNLLAADARKAPPSPVLTTEQLYVRANWMDDPNALKPSRNVLMAAQNEGFAANVPVSLMFTATESDSDMKDDESGSEADDHSRVADLIARSFNSSMLLPTKLDFTAAPASDEEDEDDVADEVDMSLLQPKASTVPVSEVPETKSKPPSTTPSSLKDMPQSLAEIYKLSNKNRKRKKKAKKSDDGAPSSPLVLKSGSSVSDSDDESDERESKRQRQSDITTPKSSLVGLSNVDFMREIGWLGKDAPVPTVVSGARADANAVNAMKLQMQPRDDDDEDDFEMEVITHPLKPKPQKPSDASQPRPQAPQQPSQSSKQASQGKSAPDTPPKASPSSSPQKQKSQFSFSQSQPAHKPTFGGSQGPRPTNPDNRGGGGYRGDAGSRGSYRGDSSARGAPRGGRGGPSSRGGSGQPQRGFGSQRGGRGSRGQ